MNKNKITYLISNPKSIFGFIISLLGIYFAFKDFELKQFTYYFFEINYIYIYIAVFFLWISVWFRALRWKYLFNGEISPTILSLYKTEFMGYFGNNVFPLRLGELMRAYIIGKEYNMSKSYVFGTIILERLLDLLSLFFVSISCFLFLPLDDLLLETIFFSSVILVLCILLIIFVFPKIKNTSNKVFNMLKNIFKGLSAIDKNNFLQIVFLSLIIWIIYGFNVYLIQKAFYLNLSFMQILILLILSSLAISIPSAPGMVGTFHATVKYILVDLFGYGNHIANSLAIFMHGYGYILLTFIGGYYFIKYQFNNNIINDVIKDSKSA